MKLRKIIPLFFLLIGVIIIATSGYMVIEGWDFFKSLYLAVITITTVGYSEVGQLSTYGRIFNMIMILTGVGVFTFIGTKLATEVASMDFKKRRRDKMQKLIDKLNEHTIVCGHGRMGEVICKQLAENNVPFVVVEKRPALLENLKKTRFLYVEGDATNDDILITAGIKRAKVLVSVIDSDSDGLYLCLAGKSLNQNLYIIVRANDQNAKTRILRAGASKVISPFVMTGRKVADCVINPAVEDLFDLTNDDSNNENVIRLADLYVCSDTTLKGKSIDEVGEEMKDLIIVGIRSSNQSFTFKPDSGYVFKEGDYIITLGPKISYEKAQKDFNLISKHF